MRGRAEVKEKHLRSWDEIVGVLQAMELTQFEAILLFEECYVSFPLNSPEGELIKNLDDLLVGKKVGMLKTDLREKPLVIRMLK